MTDSHYERISRKLKAAAGKYEPLPRDLPSDSLIQQTILSIPDKPTQTLLALQAALGARNHEVLLADCTPLALGEHFVHILGGKTGPREAWVLHPEWIEMFGLRELEPHGIKTEGVEHSVLGAIITNKAKKFKIPFNPYDLRHCWARRSIEWGLDPRISAASLGHSLDEHYKTYNKWFTHKDTKIAYKRILQDANRPKPPKDASDQSSEVESGNWIGEQHSAQFKAKVVLEAIEGEKPIAEIASQHSIHPAMIHDWKRQLLDGASKVFEHGAK